MGVNGGSICEKTGESRQSQNKRESQQRMGEPLSPTCILSHSGGLAILTMGFCGGCYLAG